MQSAPIKDYVMPHLIRNYYQISGPVAVLGTGAFSILMWYVSMTQDHSQIPCGVIAALFGGISIVAAISGFANFSRIMLEYNVGNEWVSNQWGSTENRVNLSLGVFLSKICLTFSVGNSHVKYHFLLCSNSPFPANIRFNKGGMGAIASLLDSGIVIIPWLDVVARGIRFAHEKPELIADFPRVSFVSLSVRDNYDS